MVYENLPMEMSPEWKAITKCESRIEALELEFNKMQDVYITTQAGANINIAELKSVLKDYISKLMDNMEHPIPAYASLNDSYTFLENLLEKLSAKDEREIDSSRMYVIPHCPDLDDDGECISFGDLCINNIHCENKEASGDSSRNCSNCGRLNDMGGIYLENINLCDECIGFILQETTDSEWIRKEKASGGEMPAMGMKCLKCDGYDPKEYASECEDMYNANPLRCEKTPEPHKINTSQPLYPEPDCKYCKYFITHIENCEEKCAYYADGMKLIAEFKTDFDYVWFIMEGEGIFDSVTPGDYKRLHDIKKKWEARSK